MKRKDCEEYILIKQARKSKKEWKMKQRSLESMSLMRNGRSTNLRMKLKDSKSLLNL